MGIRDARGLASLRERVIWEWGTLPRASLASLLCPGLSSFIPAGFSEGRVHRNIQTRGGGWVTRELGLCFAEFARKHIPAFIFLHFRNAACAGLCFPLRTLRNEKTFGTDYPLVPGAIG
jgi:hypothetical protein